MAANEATSVANQGARWAGSDCFVAREEMVDAVDLPVGLSVVVHSMPQLAGVA